MTGGSQLRCELVQSQLSQATSTKERKESTTRDRIGVRFLPLNETRDQMKSNRHDHGVGRVSREAHLQS
jgi:hypothetical protein